MKAEIVSEKENPVTGRKEYWLMVDHSGKQTPSRYVLLPEVVKVLASREEVTIIDKIFSERGASRSRVRALVYKDRKEIPELKIARHERKIKKHLEKKGMKPAGAKKPAGKDSAAEAAADGAE